MATSGTYNFNPSLGEIVLYSYNLCEIRNTAIAQEHMEAARMATNFLLANWSNKGVNLWTVDLQTVQFTQTPATTAATGNGTTATLTYSNVNTPIYPVGSTITVSGITPTGYNGNYVVTASANGSVSYANTTTGSQTVAGTISTSSPTASYAVDQSTVVLLDSYVTTSSNSAQPIDRIILPVSRTEYASYPNKQNTGFPTVFWYDRLIDSSRSAGSPGPSVTLWPVPDGTSAQSFSYYRVTQLQDSNFTSGQTVEIPYLWMEAFAYGLAHRLAVIWNPQKAMMLKPLADEAYQVAADQNVETAQQYISPQLAGYFR